MADIGLIRPRISALMADMPFLTAEGPYRFMHKQREWDALQQQRFCALAMPYVYLYCLSWDVM